MSITKTGFILACLLVLLTISQVRTAKAIDVSGSITEDTTWTLLNSPYIVTGQVTVIAGVTLSIQPGVVVKFASGDVSLQVYGTLNATGTSGSRIYFTSILDDAVGGDSNGDGTATSPAAGNWRGIDVWDAGSATLDYITVRYAGSYGNGAMLYKSGNNGSMDLSNSIVSNSSNHGIYVSGTPTSNTISNNSISAIGQHGIVVQSTSGNNSINGNSISGCGYNGIYLYNTTGNDTVTGNTVTGSGTHGIYCNNSTTSLQNNNVSGSAGYGLYVDGGAGIPTTVTGNTLNGNTAGPVGLAADSSGAVIADSNIFTGPVSIETGTINRAVSWPNNRVYFVKGHVSIANAQTLTIPAGRVVKFASGDVSLQVYGTLNATGTSGSRIYFTSILDDAVGGDSNGDGTATSPAAGNWRGIEIPDIGSAYIDFATIRYGGSYGYGAFVNKDASGTLSLTNSVVSHSSSTGVLINNTTTTQTLSNNIVFSNGTDGVNLSNTNSSVTLSGSVISGNGRHGVVANSSSPSIMGNTIRNNTAGSGIEVDGGGIVPSPAPTIRGNTISFNAVGIRASNGANPLIGGSNVAGTGNNIRDNTNFGVENLSATITINAGYNWWGDASGPYHSTNASGLGNPVSDYVLFANFLSAEAVPAPNGQLAPTVYDFGRMAVGRATPAQTFTISNSGSAELVVSSLGTFGVDAAMFVIGQGTCGNLPFNLSPNNSCTFTTSFVPTAKEARNAQLQVLSNDAALFSALTGTGYKFVLNVDFAGTGAGTVTATPGPVVCNTDCQVEAVADSVVTLQPARATYSLFSGWSNSCTASSGSCQVIIDSDNKTATATFTKDTSHSVKMLSTMTYYSTIMGAYNDAATSGSTIMAWGTDFTGEVFSFGSPSVSKNVVLKGGYNEAYSGNTGITRIKGPLTIVRGQLTMENVSVW